ncbi:MAG: glycosyltransferase family 2 protein [Acidobacteriaceae bacterium]|nr:glycosyltransferase family 2 protein [Acidobacteriaceae bacterium]
MKISVVTPSYNQAEFLDRTIRSVLCQDYPDLEYLILDGGSTDGSLAIIEAYADHLTYWRSTPDDGQAAAVAEGLARATGDILCYLNSDDLLAPDCLQRVATAFAQNPTVDMVFSNRCIVDPGDRITGFWLLPPLTGPLLQAWPLLPQETCFWRRNLMARAGNVDVSLRFALDYDLFVRFLRHGRCCKLPGFLAAFRRHAQAKSTHSYQTIGLAEVGQIRRRYRLRRDPVSRFLGRAIGEYSYWAGAVWGAAACWRSGTAYHIGQDFNVIWHGALRAETWLPPPPRGSLSPPNPP